MEYKLSPSILSADFCNLEEGIRQTEENGAVYLHFDVMDGVFVPSISLGMPVGFLGLRSNKDEENLPAGGLIRVCSPSLCCCEALMRDRRCRSFPNQNSGIRAPGCFQSLSPPEQAVHFELK